MTNVAIVYHSGYGHTKALAEAVEAGAKGVAGVTTHIVSVDAIEGRWDDLASASAIIFGSPTYMGGVSAPFKAFVDATSKIWYAQGWKDKLAAGFTNSASPAGDKMSTLQSMATMAAQHGMNWISLGLMPSGGQSTSTDETPNRLGFFLGAASQAFSDQGADVAPGPADRETGRLLGERVAHAAVRWDRGKAA